MQKQHHAGNRERIALNASPHNAAHKQHHKHRRFTCKPLRVSHISHIKHLQYCPNCTLQEKQP